MVCNKCGSVPFSGKNVANGELTFNYVSSCKRRTEVDEPGLAVFVFEEGLTQVPNFRYGNRCFI